MRTPSDCAFSIEQRGLALTPAGRALYDRLLAGVRQAGGAGSTGDDYPRRLAEAFAGFPDDLDELRRQGLGYFRYRLTDSGRALAPGARGAVAGGAGRRRPCHRRPDRLRGFPAGQRRRHLPVQPRRRRATGLRRAPGPGAVRGRAGRPGGRSVRAVRGAAGAVAAGTARRLSGAPAGSRRAVTVPRFSVDDRTRPHYVVARRFRRPASLRIKREAGPMPALPRSGRWKRTRHWHWSTAPGSDGLGGRRRLPRP